MDFLPLENVEEFDELIEVRSGTTKGNPRPSPGDGKERLGSSIRRLSEEKRFKPTNLSKRIIERRESHDRVRLVPKIGIFSEQRFKAIGLKFVTPKRLIITVNTFHLVSNAILVVSAISLIFSFIAYFLRDSPLCIFDSKSDDETEGLKYQNLGCGAYTALSGIVLAGLCVAFSRHQDCDADDFNWIFWLFGFSVITTVVGLTTSIIQIHGLALFWSHIDSVIMRILLSVEISLTVMLSICSIILVGMVIRSMKINSPLMAGLIFAILFVVVLCRLFVESQDKWFHDQEKNV